MKAHRDGRNVVLVMTAAEAKRFENELLWGPEDDKTSKRAWEALNGLHGED
jgi:hypothetical protein